MTAPTESTSLSERLAALKDRMGSGPEADSLTSAMTQLDTQQGHLLSLVAALTEDIQDLAPRLVAEVQELLPSQPIVPPDLTPRISSLEQLVRALAEVVNENADAHQSALSTLQQPPPPAPEVPDLTPRLEKLEQLVESLTTAVHSTLESQQAALTSVIASVEGVRAHIDSAALASVEAILSAR